MVKFSRAVKFIKFMETAADSGYESMISKLEVVLVNLLSNYGTLLFTYPLNLFRDSDETPFLLELKIMIQVVSIQGIAQGKSGPSN